MSAPFTNAMLALSPDSFWLCGEPGATLVDSVGGKNLTVGGTPSARTVAPGAPFVGVDPGINFGNAEFTGWATISSPLTQIATNKFSVVGMFRYNVTASGSSEPFFCASFSGGHTDPFYIFNAFSTAGSAVQQVAVDTTGSFFFVTNGGMPTVGSWTLCALTYDGTNIVNWRNGISSSVGRTGNIHDTMGSFSLNNIPALNSGTFAGATMAASVGYWHDYTVTSTDMANLLAAAQTPPAGPPTVMLPVSVSPALRGH